MIEAAGLTIAPFSVILEHGMPTVRSTRTYEYTELTTDISNILGRCKYSKVAIGHLARALATGESYYTKTGRFEPVPGHGVTVINPTAVLMDAEISDTNTHKVARDFVLQASKVNVDKIKYD